MPEPVHYYRRGWRLGVLYRRDQRKIHILDCGTLRTIHLPESEGRHMQPATVSRGFAQKLERRRRKLKKLKVGHAKATAIAVVKALRQR